MSRARTALDVGLALGFALLVAGAPPAPSRAEEPRAEAAPASPDPESEARAHWSGRKLELERAVDEARARVEAAEAAYSRGHRARRARGERRVEVKRELDESRKALAEAEAALAELPEEARRAGVPPGWIR